MRLSSRGLAALLAAGVILIGTALWVTSRAPSSGGTQAGKLLLPGLEPTVNTITEVRLTAGNGKVTTLEKRAEDWIVAERGFPADSGLVRRLLLELAQLKILESKTSDPAEYPVIGVESVTAKGATGTRIDLLEPGRTVSLVVGNASGDDASFVRLVGAKESLLVSPQIVPQADPKQWLDNTVINLPESRVQAVSVQIGKAPPYTVTRASAKEPDFTIPDLPRGRHLSSLSAANAVANALASFTLDDVSKPAGPQVYPDHAVFRTFDGLSVEVSGRKAGNSRFIEIAARAASKAAQAEAQQLNARFAGWELEILGYQYAAIFQPLEGLLQPLPAKPRGRPAVRRARART